MLESEFNDYNIRELFILLKKLQDCYKRNSDEWANITETMRLTELEARYMNIDTDAWH